MFPDSLQATWQEYKRGFSLPGPLYGDPRLLKLELEHIFGKEWIFAGSIAEIAKVGDFITLEVGKASIIVIRAAEKEVKAFYNVCRHRGAKICLSDKGSCSKLRCQYHQWTYDLNGRLIHARDVGAAFKQEDYSLGQIACEQVYGMIYINLSSTPSDSILRFRQEVGPYLAYYHLDKLKVAHQTDLIEEGNWKHVMENNRECHHCASNHPELLVGLPDSGFGKGLPENEGEAAPTCDDEAYFSEQRANWKAKNLPSALIEFPDNMWWRVVRLPLNQGTYTHHHIPGELGSKKLLHNFTKPEGSGVSLWTHPNGWNHFLCDQVITFRVLPLAPGKTMVRTTWLVHEEAEGHEDYDIDLLTHTWTQTNLQDRRLVEMTFQGSQSPGYKIGPYSPMTEGLVVQFLDWWHGKMTPYL